ncbi:LLM class F420-dependent oxidoreductase [Amycolatopsis sp. NPDC059657]|uniref:LLM class F420-dependent oxidoreductase n=1 Tax=Amycolatopsis sp. NPDC059657 TaxID=3346899 RepID=UPI00366AEDC9
MTIGVALPSGDTDGASNLVEELIDQTRQAAAAGIDSVWFSQLQNYDAVTVAALAGREVPGIAVGSSVVPIYPRHPLLLSALGQTAQAATGGRFTLGVGLGSEKLLKPAYGVDYPPPIRHLREYLTALRPLLNGEAAEFDGELLSSHPFAPTAVPGSAPVPILVAAMGPQALKVTGELADGTLPFLAGPRALAELIVPVINAAAESAGRPKPKIVAAFPAIVTSDVDTTREKAAANLAFYDSIPSYQKILAAEGVSAAHELAAIGDEETVAAAIRRYFDAGATEVVITQAGIHSSEDRLRTWRLAGDQTLVHSN